MVLWIRTNITEAKVWHQRNLTRTVFLYRYTYSSHPVMEDSGARMITASSVVIFFFFKGLTTTLVFTNLGFVYINFLLHWSRMVLLCICIAFQRYGWYCIWCFWNCFFGLWTFKLNMMARKPIRVGSKSKPESLKQEQNKRQIENENTFFPH